MSAPSMLPSRRRLLLRLTLATTAGLALLPTTASGNASVFKDPCPVGVVGPSCVHYTGLGNEVDVFELSAAGNLVYLMPTGLGVSMTPQAPCSAAAPPAGRVGCSLPAAAIVIDAMGGDDSVTTQRPCAGCVRLIAKLGDGNDQLRGSMHADDVEGGPGNDAIFTFEGDDTLDGGPGDDWLDPHLGADDVVGGSGYDTVVYNKTNLQPLTVTIDDVANDGEANEKDNVHSDVEDVTGGDANDTLIGNDKANVLRGDVSGDASAGADTIEGGGGADSLFGQGGNDTVRARDGVSDTVDCGPGTDTAIVDTIDTVRNCDTVDASSVLEPDADRDGISKPADCNDANPAIKPGADDIPENGVDEDCDGQDAVILDRDNDGYQRGQDCNDNNPRIHPGAKDIPGNALDEDCDGTAATYPLLQSTVGYDVDYKRRSAVFRKLFVRRPIAGSSVRVQCIGKSCTWRFKKIKIKRTSQVLDIQRHVRGTRLRRGESLEVRITKPQTVGYVARLTMGKRTVQRREQCLKPGAKRPGKCPTT